MFSAIKHAGKAFLSRRLERQVQQLRSKHDFKVIAVAGSVGKTSTKLAIANVLASQQPTRFQDGNYNDRLTVPLIFFGQTEPGIYNVPAWIKIWFSNQRALKRDFPYKFVVVELGVDGPGQMMHFAYLKPDLVVLTAVAPEHMEYFHTIDAVAAEEQKVFELSQDVLVNVDDVAAKYLKDKTYSGYGFQDGARYHISGWESYNLQTPKAQLQLGEYPSYTVTLPLLGKQGAKISLAAAAVASMLGYDAESISAGLATIQAVPGRMQILPGAKNSLIIDDTYNASPVAVKAALDVLYGADSPQRIALLGNMNELGDYSQQAHEEIGNYCDPQKLNLLVTLGADANQYLAAAAEAKGCKVQRCASAQEAGQFIAQNLQDGAIILAKGSQNGVYAEEAVKLLLADPTDAQKLVRQSTDWLARKG